MSRDPSNSLVWFTKGLIQFKQGYYEDSLKNLGVSIELAPTFPDAWHYKGIVLTYLERNDEANIAFENSKELGYQEANIVIPSAKEL